MTNQTVPITSLLVYCLLLTACATPIPTAADVVVRQTVTDPRLVASVQADQYQRDAQATLDAQARTRETLALSIQQTAVAATTTAAHRHTQATATTQHQQTADALTFALTAEAATHQAQQTRTAATVQVQETQKAQAIQSGQATATAVFVATQAALAATRQAHELAQAQAAAKREQVTTAVTMIVLLVAAVAGGSLLVVFFWQVIPTLVNRLGVVRYGQHGNPLLITERKGRTTLTNPLQMLQAGLNIEEDGRIVMPELTPDEWQALIAGGFLRALIEQIHHAPGHRPVLPSEETVYRRVAGIETERKTKHLPASKGVKRPSRPSTGETRETAVDDTFNLPTPPLDLLSALDQEQAILIHGAKGTGKTTLLKHLMARRHNCLILDPHGAPHKWPNCLMVGAGRDYEAIGLALTGLVALMNHRYGEIGQGLVPEGQHEKMTLLIDEYRGIVQNVSKSGKVITTLLTEARKAQMDMVLVSHSKLVKALGMQGEGDLREGFALVHLQESHGRRTATLDVGQGPTPVRLPGPFPEGEMRRPAPPVWLVEAVVAPEPIPLVTASEKKERHTPLFTAPSPDPAVVDAERLLAADNPAQRFTSRRRVAVFLTDGLDNRYAYQRAKAALQVLQQRHVAWAIRLSEETLSS